MLRIRLISALLGAVLVTASPVAAAPQSVSGLHAMVVGIGSDDRVIAAGVPLTSGPWGTDYITVSHALSVGRKYSISSDGKAFAPAAGLAACSSHYHGIDVLILRVRAHANRPVIDWGDPAALRQGDELFILPRREFHPEPVSVTFLHLNLLEWTRSTPGDWEPQWRNVMVGDGFSRPGFSGSPWVREGKVYGLLKGRVRPPGQNTWYTVAETATKVRECLRQVHYQELIPTD